MVIVVRAMEKIILLAFVLAEAGESKINKAFLIITVGALILVLLLYCIINILFLFESINLKLCDSLSTFLSFKGILQGFTTMDGVLICIRCILVYRKVSIFM
jgi:hypothetical protein